MKKGLKVRPPGKPATKKQVQEALSPKNAELPDQSFSAFPIVAIGASAGGLEAITQLVTHLTPDLGMAMLLSSIWIPNTRACW